MSIVPPDESYSAAEVGAILGKSERQIQRYLTSGKMCGSRSSGRWTVTALQIWKFQGIDADMLANWRAYCTSATADQETSPDQ